MAHTITHITHGPLFIFLTAKEFRAGCRKARTPIGDRPAAAALGSHTIHYVTDLEAWLIEHPAVDVTFEPPTSFLPAIAVPVTDDVTVEVQLTLTQLDVVQSECYESSMSTVPVLRRVLEDSGMADIARANGGQRTRANTP